MLRWRRTCFPVNLENPATRQREDELQRTVEQLRGKPQDTGDRKRRSKADMYKYIYNLQAASKSYIYQQRGVQTWELFNQRLAGEALSACRLFPLAGSIFAGMGVRERATSPKIFWHQLLNHRDTQQSTISITLLVHCVGSFLGRASQFAPPTPLDYSRVQPFEWNPSIGSAGSSPHLPELRSVLPTCRS